MSERVIKIFDTTMRDGEQSPGASMTLEEKVRIGTSLERLGVDIIEAGFPAASKGDFEAVREVARTVAAATVCGLARAHDGDITRAGESLQDAKNFRIHTFIATSPIHMEQKLKMSPSAVCDRAVAAVRLARSFTSDVEFSPEDAGRSDFNFLCSIIEAAIEAGANTINIPDTVGYTTPLEFGNLIKKLIEAVPNSSQAIFSVHCHNDLGLAVANSLSAVSNGACQIECTINGIGERAGNASLEELVMAIRTRKDFFNCETNIDTKQLVPVSKLVSSVTGFMVQPNKAIVGANAFAHEAGIHQDGVLKHRETYEIMKAEDVGWDSNRLVLGKHSGRNALANKLKEMGYHNTSKQYFDDVFQKFKEIADAKHEITEYDIQAIVAQTQQPEKQFTLSHLSVTTDHGKPARAVLELMIGEKKESASAEGEGPVAAVYAAIEQIIHSNAALLLYAIGNVTAGIDSLGEVSVRLEKDGRVVNGQGADPDIIIASALAYLNALNRMETEVTKNPQRMDIGHVGV